MRSYIFDFEQQTALKYGLNLTELLILDYLIKFHDSNKQQIRNINGKKFAWISYKKVIEDLPILNIKERMWQTVLANLEKKKVLEKRVIDNMVFVHIDQIKLYSQFEDYLTDDDKMQLKEQGCNKLRANDQNGQFKCSKGCKKLHPIVNYYKKRIKILIDSDKVANLDLKIFVEMLKNKLKTRISNLAYDICIKNMEGLLASEKLIILSSQATDILKLNTKGEFYNCVCECLNEIL